MDIGTRRFNRGRRAPGGNLTTVPDQFWPKDTIMDDAAKWGVETVYCYEGVYWLLNATVFDGKLPDIPIRVNNRLGRVRMFARTLIGPTDKAVAIEVWDKLMCHQQYTEVYKLMLHEAAHVWVAANGADSGRDHNSREWLAAAVEFGVQSGAALSCTLFKPFIYKCPDTMCGKWWGTFRRKWPGQGKDDYMCPACGTKLTYITTIFKV